MKVAALDLGSNTFLMLIAEVDDGIINKVYRDELRFTRIGEGVHENRRFSDAALKRASECLAEYRAIIDQENCEKVVALATSAARDVENKDDLFAMGKELNLPLQVISGDLEADLTFAGATCDRKERVGTYVVDVGGGSTEVVGSADGEQVMGTSVDIGAVRLTEMFVTQNPIQKDELKALDKYCRQKFAEQVKRPSQLNEIVAVAGTPTTLATVDQGQVFSEDLVNGYQMSLKQIEDLRDRLAGMSIEERQGLPGMDPRRADVIVAGTSILRAALMALGADSLTVSTRGVRYGIACKHGELMQ